MQKKKTYEWTGDAPTHNQNLSFDAAKLGQILTQDQKAHYQSQVLIESNLLVFPASLYNLKLRNMGGLSPPMHVHIMKSAVHSEGEDINNFGYQTSKITNEIKRPLLLHILAIS